MASCHSTVYVRLVQSENHDTTGVVIFFDISMFSEIYFMLNRANQSF